MIRSFFVILLFLSLSIGAQEEKRLALVIGNANYEKAALKNTVNDAALMKQTLEKLNFEVIYATNLERDRDMKDRIIEFGKKRGEYNVGFIYYAGHGIQVGGENYLLPTKEKFNCEDDVLNYGVNVQTIMKYLKSNSNSVNVLVLDACRNNPLEQINCPNSSRSLNDGGLAKLPAPTGSLIAFSTSANTTAADGIGDNSLFCQSLATNLLKPNKTLNQIFQSVRAEVLKESKRTGRVQEPEEASKLIGDYYFIKTDKLDFAEKIISGEIDENDLIKMYGNKEVKLPMSYYYKQGQSFFDEKKYDKAIENYKQAQKLGLIDSLSKVGLDDSNRFNREGLFFSKLAISYENLNDFNKAIDNYSIAINMLEKSQKSNFSGGSIKSFDDSYLNDIKYLFVRRGELFMTKKYYKPATNDFIKSSSVRGHLNLAKIAIEEGEYKVAKRFCNRMFSEFNSNRFIDNIDFLGQHPVDHKDSMIQHDLIQKEKSQAFLLKAVIKDRKYLDRSFNQFMVSNPIFNTYNSNRKKTYKYYGKGRKDLEKAFEYDSNNVDILFHKIFWIENRMHWKNKTRSKLEIVRLADEILEISDSENPTTRALCKKIGNSLDEFYYFSVSSPNPYIDAIRLLNKELIKNENDTSILYLRAILSQKIHDELFFSSGKYVRKYFFDAEEISINSNLTNKELIQKHNVEALSRFFLSQQEKRIALVIGNANYDKGALKNPVNDALLMARTLDTLGFDVILDTNIASRRDFVETIKEFGNKRPNYDVAFVYYAGHGVQVNNENFLLPTKEVFNSKYDVLDNALSVQNIVRYLTAMPDQVNVMILDACRDNPFEKNWMNQSSGDENEIGLAKMQAPVGSLIAFSTTAGKTSPDVEGENSIYCQLLTKNMLVEGVNLDQVFRNTRSQVLKLSDGKQMTEESSQLMGKTFYLNRKKYYQAFKNPLTVRGNYESIVDENGLFLIDSILCNHGPGVVEIINVQNFKFTHEDDFRKACYLGHPTACNFLNYETYRESRYKRYKKSTSALVFKAVTGTNKLFYRDGDLYPQICNEEDANYYTIITLDNNLNPVGLVKDYYMNDTLKFQGNLKVFKPNVNVQVIDGVASWFNKNGLLDKKAFYVNGKLDHYIECRNHKGEVIECE